MSKRPERSRADENYSVDVIVYSTEYGNMSELGFFAFHDDQWHHHGSDSLKFICWANIPTPIIDQKWKPIRHAGYCD